MLTTGFWGDPGAESSGTYRPLTVLTLAFDHRLGGGRPWAFHLTNLLLHGLAVAVAFLVLADRLRDPVLSALAALLFGWHAVHTENVAGIVGRADVLATLLGLSAWALARRRRLGVALCAGPALLLALLAKEGALAAAGLILADDLLGLDHARPASRRTRMCALLALALAIGLWLALRVYATGHVAAPVGFQSNPLVGAGAGARLLTAAHLLGRTIGLLLAPLVLSADYSYAEILPVHTLARADVLCALALALALPALALRLRTRRPALALAIIVFGVTYLPVANLLVLIPTIFAERLLYLPALGLCLALAAFARTRRFLLVACALVALGHGVRAAVRTRDWRSQRTLFTSAAAASPGSARVWFNLGTEDLNDHDYVHAAERLGRAVAIAPDWAGPHATWGIALDLSGDPVHAQAAFQRAVALDPRCRDCALNLTHFYLRHRQLAPAQAEVTRFENAGGEAALVARLRADLAHAQAAGP